MKNCNEGNDKMERKNALYLGYENTLSNFYYGIKNSMYIKTTVKSDINSLSIESYDVFIIDYIIFLEKSIEALINKIISLNKPVIIVYSSEYTLNNSFFKYMTEKYKIKFVKRDCSVIENSYDDYSIRDENGYAYSMICTDKYGKAFIKNTSNCYIIRFNNVSIIHDIKITSINKKITQVENTIKNLINPIPKSTKPNWVDKISILNDKDIKKQIDEYDYKIEQLKKKQDEKYKILAENEEYKKVLYTNGNELVSVVKKIIYQMTNIPINDIDNKKEDLSLNINGKKVLIEVKGVNEGFRRDNVLQIQRHINDAARKDNIDESDVLNKYKGVLIINPFIKTPVKERIQKDIYSMDAKNDIDYFNICAIDTITLLSLFNRFKKGESIDLKDIFLNNNYNEPDFSIIDDYNNE